MLSQPPFGLLLDVDGPVASPITRTLAIPSLAHDLASFANSGVPVIFNTGRSDDFIATRIAPTLLGAGLTHPENLHTVSEKGGVWASFTDEGIGALHIDEARALPKAFFDAMRELALASFADTMFFDETKRVMVSLEQRTDVDSITYHEAQERFDAAAMRELERLDLGYTRRNTGNGAHTWQNSHGHVSVRVDPTIISTDIESIELGKALGASRAIELVQANGPVPTQWYTAGDSRGDYAMADWLHEHGYSVSHLDVRPADGVPVKPYPILTRGSLIHDAATADLLAELRPLVGVSGSR